MSEGFGAQWAGFAARSLLVLLGLSLVWGYQQDKRADKLDGQLTSERAATQLANQNAQLQAKADRAGYEKSIQELKDEYNDKATAIASGLQRQLSDADSLRQRSEVRANFYQQQARAGGDEAQRLADQASQLDAALSEGRGLVIEYRALAAEQRQQIETLGKALEAATKAAGSQI